MKAPRHLLLKCLIASLSLHFLFIFLLDKYPFVLQFSSIPLKKEEEIMVRRELLDETFNQMQTILLDKEPFTYASLSPQKEKWEGKIPSLTTPQEFALNNDFIASSPQEFFLEENETQELAHNSPSAAPLILDKSLGSYSELLLPLPPTLFTAEEKDPRFSFPSATTEASSLEITAAPPPLHPVRMPETSSFSPQEGGGMPVLVEQKVLDPSFLPHLLPAWKKTLPFLAYYHFNEADLPEEWNDSLKISLHTMSHPEEKGMLFSIALSPQFQANPLPQNFIFLLDRSNSVEKHRFTSFKRATLRALSSLKPGDCFNIICFDRKRTWMQPKSIPYSKKALRIAEAFLEKQESSGLFAACDIYQAVKNLLPKEIEDFEIQTYILFSDGNTLLSGQKKHKALLDIIEQNDGRIALYTAAAGEGNNLTLLSLLATSNGGKLLYSDTFAAFPRKMAKLVLDMHAPLGSKPSLLLSCDDPGAKMSLYPELSLPSTLYNNNAYFALGSCKYPTNCTLTLHLKRGDRSVVVQKKISTADFIKNPPLVENKWSLYKSRLAQTNFLKDGKSTHLK